MNKQKPLQYLKKFLLFGVILGIGIGMGWLLKGQYGETGQANTLTALRISGYKHISPLLACDRSQESDSEVLGGMKKDLQDLITNKTAQKQVDTVSIYFRDFNSGNSLDINPELQYFPASLNKIPIMISLFKAAEANPLILQQKIQVPAQDNNTIQEIKPKETLNPGGSYTIEEAINKMIQYSDNNAFYALLDHTDVNVYKQINEDLKVPLEGAATSNDYRTARDFSYFLRVLYNATYINKDLSEKALQLLSQVAYANGLRAGVPQNVEVAHKFGDAVSDNKNPSNFFRELHDCGIIYHQARPYLLCVMTKSSGTLEGAENTIKDISDVVYKAVDHNFQ